MEQLDLKFICNKEDGLKNTSVTILQHDRLINVVVEFKSAVGCPLTSASAGGSGSSSGWYVSTWLLVITATYFGGGMAYNYFVNKIAFFPDILPHHEFWTNLYNRIAAIFSAIWAKLTNASSGYISL